MTPPKKWPQQAEWARLDAVVALETMHRQAREAQGLIVEGRGLQAMYLLTLIADGATRAKESLQHAKGSRS